MGKQFTLREFQGRFQTEEDCYAYLCQQKWGKGYACRRCQHKEYVQVDIPRKLVHLFRQKQGH